jgi:predicted peroxiredoxin
MAGHMLYVGCHGIDDPNQAGLVFAAAIAATGKKYDAKIALLADAVLLMKDNVAEHTIIAPTAQRGSVKYLLEKIRKSGVEIWV